MKHVFIWHVGIAFRILWTITSRRSGTVKRRAPVRPSEAGTGRPAAHCFTGFNEAWRQMGA